jgi:hypothetical protein
MNLKGRELSHCFSEAIRGFLLNKQERGLADPTLVEHEYAQGLAAPSRKFRDRGSRCEGVVKGCHG